MAATGWPYACPRIRSTSGVADTQAHHEAAGEGSLHGARAGVRRDGVTAVDAGDAGGDRHPAARRQVDRRGRQGLAAVRLAEPQGVPALLVERGDLVPGGRDLERVEGGRPDPDRPGQERVGLGQP